MERYKFSLSNCSIKTNGNELIVTVNAEKRWRAPQNGQYYFIDDTLSLNKATEQSNPKDKYRWEKGNYFKDANDATTALNAIIPTFNKTLYLE